MYGNPLLNESAENSLGDEQLGSASASRSISEQIAVVCAANYRLAESSFKLAKSHDQQANHLAAIWYYLEAWRVSGHLQAGRRLSYEVAEAVDAKIDISAACEVASIKRTVDSNVELHRPLLEAVQLLSGLGVAKNHVEAEQRFRALSANFNQNSDIQMQAKYHLALMYRAKWIQDITREQANAQAASLLIEVAKEKYAPAQYTLGKMYLLGDIAGVSRQSADAYQAAGSYLQLAAKAGHVRAQYQLALLCQKQHFHHSLEGYDSSAKRLAAYWFGLAAKHGHSTAQHRLDLMYFDDLVADFREGGNAQWWVEQGVTPIGHAGQNASAASTFVEFCVSRLVDLYANGSQQDRQAIYQKLRSIAPESAKCLLADLYTRGEGDTSAIKDYQAAIGLLQEIVENPSEENRGLAWYMLASIYRTGCVPNFGNTGPLAPGFQEAAKYYRLAGSAQRPHLRSQYQLALMYFEGLIFDHPKGDDETQKQALLWFHASRQFAESKFYLGFLATQGWMKDRSPNKVRPGADRDQAAVGWWDKAAREGDVLAKYARLAFRCETGLDSMKDLLEAERWYRVLQIEAPEAVKVWAGERLQALAKRQKRTLLHSVSDELLKHTTSWTTQEVLNYHSYIQQSSGIDFVSTGVSYRQLWDFSTINNELLLKLFPKNKDIFIRCMTLLLSDATDQDQLRLLERCTQAKAKQYFLNPLATLIEQINAAGECLGPGNRAAEAQPTERHFSDADHSTLLGGALKGGNAATHCDTYHHDALL